MKFQKMIRIRKRVFLAASLALTGATFINGAVTRTFYAQKSKLAEGTWVKIGVDKTGVYSISYDELRQMGFSNPEKVSLYGRGGRRMSEALATNSGIPLISDDVSPVKVLHEGGNLYFYGLGPESIIFETSSDYAIGGYFKRTDNNIYSNRGYYFLTDSGDVQTIEESNFSTNSASDVVSGVSYVYHEIDSVQNSTLSGQLFWGESIGLPGLPVKNWAVELPDAIPGKGVMQCEMYFSVSDYGKAATVSYGFEGSDYFKTNYSPNTALYYAPHQPSVSEIGVPGKSGKVFVGFEGATDMGNFSNLDFWVVSYNRAVPTMTDATGKSVGQQLMALPSISKNTVGKIELENSASLMIWDVTDETSPQSLRITQTGNIGTVGVRNAGKAPVVVVFDKDKPQYKISGYEKGYTPIANQNLHALRDTGADFVIISTPEFLSYAEEIAQLHRDYDGIEVAVATPEQVYNEFSAGVPDPVAIRSFVKMLYLADTKVKNVLLFGPLTGDIRGVQAERDPFAAIIGYQSPTVSTTRGAHNINDFYGMMDDKFRTDYYERNNVQVGVGILPVKFESEAKIMVNKIRNHLARTDHAYFLNRYTAVGGLGDAHTHDTQINTVYNYMSIVDNRATIYTPLAIDTYGNQEARKKLINSIEDGCNLISYFGHGAEQFLGQDKEFFNAGDVYKLKNRVLPFALFGGCQITNTDRGFKGLGEMIVTDTENGCIGTIVSARETWSGQNLDFFKSFFVCYYTEGSTTISTHRAKPATIGEIYAKLKNYSTSSNELAYQLLCDPALVLPMVNNKIDVTFDGNEAVVTPGESVKLSGSIIDFSGNEVTDFNGEIVVRLNEPEKTLPAGCIVTGEDPKNLQYTYRDNQVTMATANVKNGKFDISFHVPASAGTFNGQNMLLYLCAYDPDTRISAGQCYTATVTPGQGASAEASDKVPPVIESFAFDSSDASISFAVSDNLALNLSSNPLDKGVYLYIDGKERSEAHFAEPVIETGRPAFSKTVSLEGLSYGEHSARLKVKDAAGNTTEQEILFTYQPYAAKYALLRGDESSIDKTRIMIDGLVPEKATLVVISSKGTEVWRGDVKGSYIDWSHIDNAGNKVVPGHYKAYLIETGTGSLKGHAEPIDIPVI